MPSISIRAGVASMASMAPMEPTGIDGAHGSILGSMAQSPTKLRAAPKPSLSKEVVTGSSCQRTSGFKGESTPRGRAEPLSSAPSSGNCSLTNQWPTSCVTSADVDLAGNQLKNLPLCATFSRGDCLALKGELARIYRPPPTTAPPTLRRAPRRRRSHRARLFRRPAPWCAFLGAPLRHGRVAEMRCPTH